VIIVQVAKVAVKDVVMVEPAGSLPAATVVQMSVTRLRPKSSEECRIETTDMLEAVQHLQGVREPGPGIPRQRWPVCVNLEYFIVWGNNTIFSCKVCLRNSIRELSMLLLRACTTS
jgi:hypothetical protein